MQRFELVEPVSESADSGSELQLGVRAPAGHVHVWSYENAPRDACFGGWPVAALIPSTPLRLLRFDVRDMWPEIVPEVQGPAGNIFTGFEGGSAPDVSFERNGRPLDAETTLGQLCDWAQAGARLDVVVNGARVPLRFGTAMPVWP